MNIKITYSWLLEYLDTKADPYQIQKYVSLCGPSVERVDKVEDDYVFDIEITSNRVDAASVYGFAREAAVILNQFGISAKLKPLSFSDPQTPEEDLELKVIDDSGLCKRVLAVVLDNVTIGPAPEYIKKRLEAAGIRSLNNVVDVTNYVMTEMGHPTHVFDYDRIATHKLILRYAKEGEKIITLDDKKYNLSKQDIIIDDGTGKVIDLPGIMGTANSVVVDKTKRVILFIESNDPATIRRSSMRYGIRTVAATINEKNPDPELAKTALLRGVQLLEKVAGAHVAGSVLDIYPNPYEEKKVKLDYDSFEKIIGVKLGKKQIDDILGNLGFKIYNGEVGVPSWRQFDINIKEDLVEEVARIYGYNILPNNIQSIIYLKQPAEIEKLFEIQSKIKYLLKHLGLNEVMNYSMISRKMIEENGLKTQDYLRLSNSLSEEIEFLRNSLVPSLIKNIKTNSGRKEELKFFEIAKVYLPKKNTLPNEPYKLGLAVNTDYFDLKGIIESVLKELNITEYSFNEKNDRNVELTINNRTAGLIYLGQAYFVAELALTSLIENWKTFPKYRPINPYAIIKLDLTVDLDKNKNYQHLKEISFKSSKLLNEIQLIGLYKNKITLRYFFTSTERNLTETEALAELQKIKEAF